jgi:hypothetical protein
MLYRSNNELDESIKKYVEQLTPEKKLSDLRSEILRLLSSFEANVAFMAGIHLITIEGLPKEYGECITRLTDRVKDLRDLIDIFVPEK